MVDGFPRVDAGPIEGATLSGLAEEEAAAAEAAAGVGSEVMRSMSVIPVESWPDAMAIGFCGLRRRPVWNKRGERERESI